MKIKPKEILDNFFGQIKNTKTLAIILIVGIVLMMLPTKTEKEASVSIPDESTYKLELEEELSEIIGKIKGAGRVSVMVMLSDSGNTYYATDEKSDSKTDSESQEKTHVFSDEGNKKQALVVKKTEPHISGVLICADGAGNIEVRKNIISAVTALTGVKSHRIEVLERG